MPFSPDPSRGRAVADVGVSWDRTPPPLRWNRCAENTAGTSHSNRPGHS
jgi:hypothetical protein